MLWQMTTPARLIKSDKTTPLLPATLPLQTQAGPVQPPELRLSPLLRVSLQVDHLRLDSQGSSQEVRDHSRQFPGRQGNTQDLLQCRVGFPQGYLDNFHLHQGLQGSSHLVLELLDSSLGIIHLKELLASYLEAPFLTQLDPFLLVLELPLVLILICLSQVYSQEQEMGCMDQGAQAHSPLLSQAGKAFLQCPQGLGDHLQEVFLLRLVSPLVPGQWGSMVDIQLKEACW